MGKPIATPSRKGFTNGAIRVHVSRTLVEDSMMRNSSHCMVAEAIKECVPNAGHVSVDMLTIRYTDPEKGLRYTHLTPRSVAKAIIMFDQGAVVEPFSFELRKPAQIRRSGWRANHMNSPERKKTDSEPKPRVLRNGTVRGGRSIPQMSTRREFGARLFVR